jgi:sarcosine oxidase subunit beta
MSIPVTSPHSAAQQNRANVVIIGGGIMGAATAYWLARAGIRDVILMEAGDVASGSSGKPLGGVRSQFSDVTNVELGLRSLRTYARFREDLGVDIGLQTVGYLFALRSEQDVVHHEASIQLQNAMGVPSRMIDAAQARALCPYLDDAQILAATWSSNDGFARPVDAVHGLVSAAAAFGVQMRTHTRVVGIDAGPAQTASVRLDDGSSVGTPTVICTAGAWSRQIGAMVGVDLPVVPKRREIAFTPPLDPRPPRIPFTIDYSTTAYFHASENDGLLLGWADPDQPEGFEVEVTDGWHDNLRAALMTFAPDLADVPISHGWAGLYEITPDCNALIGESQAPGFRFLYATGFSGHGFLQGPAVGECVRDLVLGRTPVVDVSGFTAERFLRPAVRTELGII